MELMKLSSIASGRHKSKADATKDQAWSIGTEFKNRDNKFSAKRRVLSELESATKKELTKV